MLKKTTISLFLIVIVLAIFAITAETYSVFKDEWKAIIELNEELINNDNEDIAAHFRLAIAFANIGNVEEAMDKLNYVSQFHERSKAVEFLNELTMQLLFEPENHIANTEKAFVLFTLQCYTESIRFFDKCLVQDPENIWLHNYKALCYFAMVENERAKEILRQSLDIKNNKYTHGLMGYIYWTEGSYVQATFHFARTGSLFFTIKKLFL